MSGKGSRQRPTAPTYGENYDRIFAPTAKSLRDKHLNEAREVILNAPPMSAEMRERMDRIWAAFDAAYPQPMDLNPKEPK